MEILDAQVHMWLSDRPSRPWDPRYREQMADQLPMLIHTGQTVSPEGLLIEMAEAGVDGGVLSPVGVYGTNNSFELQTARRFPRKFCVVGWIDHMAPDAVETLESDAADGMVGVRILGIREQARLERREFDTILGACERLSIPVSLPLAYPLAQDLRSTLTRYPEVRFVFDHLGLGLAPPTRGPVPNHPFENLPVVLEFSQLDNVYIKLTAAPALSHERYPFKDTWQAVERIVDAYGADRIMWGSDFTRTAALHSYWDATHFLSEMNMFSADQLAALYGGTLRKVLDWYPAPSVRPTA